jgi:phosphatidylglycerol:prolipoprotein diacylglycerol transferase
MHPLLLKIGPIPIHTYGFLIAVGFLVALYVLRKLAERSKLDVERVLDLGFWSLLVGFVGARALFIITRFSYFMDDPMAIFKVWEGGLVFLGGPVICIPFVIWYTRKHKLAFWKTMDCLGPPLVIAHMFGRFGCLSAGCCYGKPTTMPWGIRLYSDLVEKDLRGIPLHPTQLYEAGALFVIFWGLLWVFKHKKFDGQVAFTYLMVYPIVRSIIEIFRGDLVRGFVIDEVLSTSQFISILVFVGAAIALYINLGKLRKAEAAGQAV